MTQDGHVTTLMSALQMILVIPTPLVPTQKAPFTARANLVLLEMASITALI